MAKRKSITTTITTRKKNTIAGEILFAEARARLDEILELIGEFNKICEGLQDMGYGADGHDETHEWETCGLLPSLTLVSNNCFNVDDGDEILDQYWNVGPAVTETIEINHRQVMIRNARLVLGEACGWVCEYCGRPGDKDKGPDGRMWHVDHIYPIVRGGDSQRDNLSLACATCNLAKRTKSAMEYFEEKRRADEG